LTQSHVPSRSAATQPVFTHCAVTRHITIADDMRLIVANDYPCARVNILCTGGADGVGCYSAITSSELQKGHVL